MGILTDTDIRNVLCTDKAWSDKDKLHIYPFDEDCLTPVGYDIRVGESYASSMDAEVHSLDGNGELIVCPGDTIMVTTLENIGMPSNRSLAAFITSKVSKVSKGLSHISTNIDPDWKGNLLIAIHNPSRNTVKIKYGEPFCTINFITTESPSTKDCGFPEGRTDILLKKFASDAIEARKLARTRQHKIGIFKMLIIVCFGVGGYSIFQNSSGLIASVAMGVAIASYWPFSKKD